MIFTVKALLTLAACCFAIGYAARQRSNPLHRIVMPLGLGLALMAVPVVLVGLLRFGAVYRPAYWLVSALGSPERVRWVLIGHAGLVMCALLILGAQAFSGARRLTWHGRLFPYALGVWTAAYVTSMFWLA